MAKAAATISPFAPASLPDVPLVAGRGLAACEAGIRYKGRTDLLLAVLAPGTNVAGVLTRSKTCSAPVLWCRHGLAQGKARALVVNSGNANAFTGKKGSRRRSSPPMQPPRRSAARPARCSLPRRASSASRSTPASSRICSTSSPAARPDAFETAARAIMTTDTFPKLATRTAKIDGCASPSTASAKAPA